ncbi:hypothetical protein D3C80_348630 [compost metagenome]
MEGSAASRASIPRGSLLCSPPATVSLPPPQSGPSISSKEMSKAGVVIKSQWQLGDNPSRSRIPSRKQRRARRLMTTPLGSPVEPEVNIM